MDLDTLDALAIAVDLVTTDRPGVTVTGRGRGIVELTPEHTADEQVRLYIDDESIVLTVTRLRGEVGQRARFSHLPPAAIAAAAAATLDSLR